MTGWQMGEGRRMAEAMEAELHAHIHGRLVADVESLQEGLEEVSPVGDPSQWESGHKAPPGYVGGSFQKAWLPYAGFAPDPPAGTEGGKPSVRAAMRSWEPGMNCGLVNNSPQGRKLEWHALSKQIPFDFVARFLRVWLEWNR